MLALERSLEEMFGDLGRQARTARLSRELTQSELAEKAGVPDSTYRLFERTGKGSIELLLRVSTALGGDQSFSNLLPPRTSRPFMTIDDVLREEPKRQRGRRK